VKLLRSSLVRSFLPAFLGGVLFFVLILELAELLPNIPRYVNSEASISQVSLVALYHAPKCVSYAIPISLLFAVSYTLGSLYARNELIAIFTSGVSIRWLMTPMLGIGLILSLLSFQFEDSVVIASTRLKNKKSQEILRQSVNRSNTNFTVLGRGGAVVYSVYYYNDQDQSLQNVTVVERDPQGRFLYKLVADRARYIQGAWTFERAQLYRWTEDGRFLKDEYRPSFRRAELNDPPEKFRKLGRGIDEMTVREAKEDLEQRKQSGYPSNADYAEYYRRFAFSLTPLIVMLISAYIGGRFKKNILIMSLVSSLIISVFYYVTQMVSMIFAKLGYLPPMVGAWIPSIVFLMIGGALSILAKT